MLNGNTMLNKEQILNLLSQIPDPEIPVISIREIGMLRDVNVVDNNCEVIITPTYTGCPAMGIIEDDIKSVLLNNGVNNVSVKLVYSPSWTTDWMTTEAREKMRKYGIAPPVANTCVKSIGISEKPIVVCPRCSSKSTSLISQFGSTACKALYKCNDCKEPFEYFKCH